MRYARKRAGNRWLQVNLDQRRWKQLRYDIQLRDGFKCVNCGSTLRLELDHVIPLEQGGDLYDPDNLQTLCKSPCHDDKTRSENASRLSHTLGDTLKPQVEQLTLKGSDSDPLP